VEEPTRLRFPDVTAPPVMDVESPVAASPNVEAPTSEELDVGERMPVSRLAEMAAAAGQGEPITPAPATSETSQRFLEPMGTVKLAGEEQGTRATETNQRFRRSVLSPDKSRPAWERKYVD